MRLSVPSGVKPAALVLLGDIGHKATEQGLVDRIVSIVARARRFNSHIHLTAGHNQLAVHLAPLSDLQIRQIFSLTQLSKLVLAQCLALLLGVVPEIQPAYKVGSSMIKPSVLLIRLSALVCRPLSGILNRQAADNHQNFVQTIAGSRVDQDTSELGVDG